MAERFSRHPAVQAREDGEGAVLLHLDTHEYFELNGSAWLLWRLLPEHPTAEALASALVAEHGVPPLDATPFVQAWLTDLTEGGLLVVEGRERRRDRWLRRLGVRR